MPFSDKIFSFIRDIKYHPKAVKLFLRIHYGYKLVLYKFKMIYLIFMKQKLTHSR